MGRGQREDEDHSPGAVSLSTLGGEKRVRAALPQNGSQFCGPLRPTGLSKQVTDPTARLDPRLSPRPFEYWRRDGEQERWQTCKSIQDTRIAHFRTRAGAGGSRSCAAVRRLGLGTGVGVVQAPPFPHPLSRPESQPALALTAEPPH